MSDFPKLLIRCNANIIVLFKQDERNLHHVYNDHVNTDIDLDTFKNICSRAWNKDSNSFIVIDKESVMNKGRYRFGFDTFINI